MARLRLIVKFCITYRCLSSNKHQTFPWWALVFDLWNGKPVRWPSNRELVLVSFKAFHTFTSQSSTLPSEGRANPALGTAATWLLCLPVIRVVFVTGPQTTFLPPPPKVCFRKIAMKCKTFSTIYCWNPGRVIIGGKSGRIVMWHVWYYLFLHSTLSILSTPRR